MFFKKKLSLGKFADSFIEDSINSVEANKTSFNKIFEASDIKIKYNKKHDFELLILEWFVVSRSIISISNINFDPKFFLDYYSKNLWKNFKKIYDTSNLNMNLIHKRLEEYNKIFDVTKEDNLGFIFGKIIINNFFENNEHDKNVILQQTFSNLFILKIINTVDFMKKIINDFNISQTF